MVGERGSPRIERAPSARGPNSIRPWNQPTAWPVGERLRRRVDQRRRRRSTAKRAPAAAKPLLDLALREGRAEIGACMPSRPLLGARGSFSC